MPFIQHPFTRNTDLEAMIALARTFPDDHLRVMDLPYRLSSWALDDPANVALWRDATGTLLGWAALQTPFWTIDITCHPQAGESLYQQILAWADQRAREVLNNSFGRPCWFVTIFADQMEHNHSLTAAGFASQADVGEDSWSKVWMRRPQQAPLRSYRLPDGFTIRPLAGESEVQAYVDLHQSVFESKNMTFAWRSRTLQRAEYRPDLDIVVQAPDGRLAAFCIGWLCQLPGKPPFGQVEPLGCHADFRRYALGRVTLAEVLHRLSAAGAAEVYVETDNYRDTAMRLYESVGFQTVRNVLIFRKDYA